MTAPPKGFEGNFNSGLGFSSQPTTASSTKPADSEGAGERRESGVLVEGEGGVGDRQRRVRARRHPASPLRQPRYLSARVAYDPPSPDPPSTTRYEKVARSEEESSQSMATEIVPAPLAAGNRSCALA